MNDAPTNDDAEFSVYNGKLIALSGRAAVDAPLENAAYGAKAVSPICGSEVSVQFNVKDNKITAFGFNVEACALTRSVVGVMREAIIGKTRADVARAGGELEDLLEGRAVVPSGDWADLLVLAPLKDYTARHNAMLLPFEAVEKAFSDKA